MESFKSGSRRLHRQSQRGIVLVAVLVLLTISLTLFGIWARQLIREQGHLGTERQRLQAIRLAEAGLERAIALRAADSTFEKQIWSVPASQLDQKHDAEVRISVTPDGRAGTLRYEATAVFPVGDVHSVQLTKSITVSGPIAKDRS
jgi:Tfp pilus assembly protein PilX